MKQLVALFLCTVLLLPACASSQKATDSDKPADQNEQKKEESKFDELTKDAEKVEGYFDLYHKDDKLYLSVPKDRLNEQFLMSYEISRGIGSSFLFGGQMLTYSGLLVSLENHEGKLFLVEHPTRYKAEEGTPEAKAVDLSFGSSVVETAKIEAYNADSTEMLVNVYDWFVGDISGISDRVGYVVSSTPGRPGRVSFDKSRSHLEKVQAFPENVNISAKLTFRNSEQGGPRPVPDTRFIPLSLFYTMVKLPEEPMQPRMADDRAGYFMTVHKDFTDDNDTFFQRYVNRWRLECDGPAGSDGLCDPKKPITYYIDHTVPEQYREAMIDGVEAWSDAFEAAGFRNAVQAELLPDSVMAEDIRYPTLRWNTNDQSLYGAIGPSVVDPRTGEILDADILFEANMLLGTKEDYREFVEPRKAIDRIFNVSEEEIALMSRGIKTESFYNEMNMQMQLAHSLMAARGERSISDPVSKEFVNEFMKFVTMHEVGHTLGLRHNFRSSVDTPLDKLYDKEWTNNRGLSNSAMEYPSVNLHPEDPSNDGHYYTPGIGSYDRWVISYGYTPDDDQAETIARQAARDGHAYGTDEDAWGSNAVDPHVNVWDLGADPLAWGKDRADLLSGLIPLLPEIVLEDNTPYFEATDLFQTYLFQYAGTLAPAVKYIGGQHQYRDHVGDPEGRMPFVPVSEEKQQEALDMIVQYALSADAITLPREVYQQMGADRWSHWGNSNTYGGRIDYPLHQTLVGIQSSLLVQLFNPVRLSRIRDTEVKFGEENTLTIPDLMSQVTEAVWSEVWNSPGSDIESNRRDLQRVYLNEVIELVTDAPDGTPADARSVARVQLRELSNKLERRMAPPAYNFNEYTRAHLEESKARIDAALQAGLQLEN